MLQGESGRGCLLCASSPKQKEKSSNILATKNNRYPSRNLLQIIFRNIFFIEAVLDEAHKVNPSTHWWIKADKCDVISCLGEATHQKWSGDVDYCDGAVHKKQEDYLRHVSSVSGIVRDLTQDNIRKLTITDLQEF